MQWVAGFGDTEGFVCLHLTHVRDVEAEGHAELAARPEAELWQAQVGGVECRDLGKHVERTCDRNTVEHTECTYNTPSTIVRSKV